MNRSQIEYILSLEKYRNFSRAAEACYVTQSTLSAMVAKWEKEINVKIFDRKTKPVGLTSEGEVIVKALKSISREFQLLDDRIKEIKGYELDNLSIACIPTIAPYLYPLILNKLSKAYPKVNFAIFEYTTEKVIEEILAGNIDIGIVSTPLEHKEIKEIPLYNEDFLLYDCADTKEKKKYQIADIDLDRLWLMEEGHCMRNQVGKICELRQQKKIRNNLSYNCGTIFTLIEMVKKDKGITLLPRLALANSPQLDLSKIHHLSSPVPSREVGLVTHINTAKKEVLTRLSQIIKSTVSSGLTEDIEMIRVDPF